MITTSNEKEEEESIIHKVSKKIFIIYENNPFINQSKDKKKDFIWYTYYINL